MSENPSLLSRDAIILLIITVTSILFCYYYEIGQSAFYGIPIDFIVIDLSIKGKLVFILFAALFSGISLSMMFESADRIGVVFRRNMLKVVIVIYFIMSLLCSIITPLFIETIILLFAFSTCLVLFRFFTNNPDERIPGAEYWKHKLSPIPKSIGLFLTNWILYTILGCFMLMNVGFLSGLSTFRYFVNNNNLALVKRYGSTNFYCLIRNDSLISGRVYFRDSGVADTLHIEWVKPKYAGFFH